MIKKFVEKRKYRRFFAQEVTYAFLKNHFSKVGHIVDISLGGISIQYISDDKPASTGPFEIDILFNSEGFYLEKLKGKLVSDFVVSNDNPFSSIPMRRLCLEFQSVSMDQRDRLEYFIRRYTQTRES